MFKFRYPAFVTSNGEGGSSIAFRDIPEAISEAWADEDILEIATDALITAIDFYIEDQRKLPEPSEQKDGEIMVELPISIACKVTLLNCMVENNIRPVDLAKKMGTTPQTVNRILNLRHNTKIDTLGNAFKALGKELVLRVE